MRKFTQSICTIATLGFTQGRMTTIALCGHGVRALVNALAFYPAALLSESKSNASARFAERKSGRGIGCSVVQSAIVRLLRGLLLGLPGMRRRWLPCDAERCDAMSPAGIPHAAYADV